jgi:hypothetical protein
VPWRREKVGTAQHPTLMTFSSSQLTRPSLNSFLFTRFSAGASCTPPSKMPRGRGGSNRGKRGASVPPRWAKQGRNGHTSARQYDIYEEPAFEPKRGFSMKDEAKETSFRTSAFTTQHLWHTKIEFVPGGWFDAKTLLSDKSKEVGGPPVQIRFERVETEFTMMAELGVAGLSLNDIEEIEFETIETTTHVSTGQVKGDTEQVLPAVPKSLKADDVVDKRSSHNNEPLSDAEEDTVIFSGRNPTAKSNTTSRQLQASTEQHPPRGSRVTSKQDNSKRKKPPKKLTQRQEDERLALEDYRKNLEQFNAEVSEDSGAEPAINELLQSSSLSMLSSDTPALITTPTSIESPLPDNEEALIVLLDTHKMSSSSSQTGTISAAGKAAQIQDDEAVARLLAKQEELGLGVEELLLYDGNTANLFDSDTDSDNSTDDDDLVAGFFTGAQKGKSIRNARGGEYDFDFEGADFVNDFDFDIMDLDRPSLQNKRKGKKGVESIIHEDADLQAQLREFYEKDRNKKRERKLRKEDEAKAIGRALINGDEFLKQLQKWAASDRLEWVSSLTQSVLTFF